MYINIIIMRVNDFMLHIHKKLMNQKDVVEATATKYIKDLYLLNNKKPFNNLAFLKKYDEIEDHLKPYATTTKKNLITSIVSVLSLVKKTSYKKSYEHWSEKLADKQKDLETHKGEKSATQNANWVEWKYIENAKNELLEKLKEFCDNKLISNKQYKLLLQYIVLSLYTDIPPRRNRDYQEMYVIGNHTKKYEKLGNSNYLDYKNKQLIFNQYKTSKKYGKQIVGFKDNKSLEFALNCYLKHHPLRKRKISRNTHFRLLVQRDGSPLQSVNSITRILNKALGKNIGSSLLRHIYLTSKYKTINNEMENDAKDMAHSLAQQKDYVLE